MSETPSPSESSRPRSSTSSLILEGVAQADPLTLQRIQVAALLRLVERIDSLASTLERLPDQATVEKWILWASHTGAGR